MKFAKSVIDRMNFADVDYLKSVKETMSHTRVTQFPASNTSHVKKEKHNLTSLGGGRTHSTKVSRYQYDKKKGEINVEHRDYSPDKEVRTTKKIPANAAHEKELKNASMKSYGLFNWGEYFEKGRRSRWEPRWEPSWMPHSQHDKKDHDDSTDKEAKTTKKIPTNAANEKELKNASLHTSIDEILEKGRPRASERKDPNRRKTEDSEDALVVPDSKHVQTMSNPGPTEAEHYERTKSDSMANLKRLAESKDPSDRKAAAAGMKRHE